MFLGGLTSKDSESLALASAELVLMRFLTRKITHCKQDIPKPHLTAFGLVVETDMGVCQNKGTLEGIMGDISGCLGFSV